MYQRDAREDMYQAVFHWVLPEPEPNESITKFRARCQIALARWQVSRDIERDLSADETAAAPLIVTELCDALGQALNLLEADGSRHNIWHDLIERAQADAGKKVA